MTAEAPTQLPAIRKPPAEALKQLERVVLEGNLAMLTEGERVAYYARVCESLGLNPLTRPFEYITLNNKLTLYVRKDATDQLRDLHGVSIPRLERERDDELGLFTVIAYCVDRYGREDSGMGVVSIKGLGGEALANAMMKAETKAKRRGTLSICGLGWMDELEALDTRAVEVAPRAALKSAIASRTAALTGGTDPGESDAGAVHAASGAEAVEEPKPSTAGSPACAHDPKNRKATDAGIVCGDCGVVLAERTETDGSGRTETDARPRPRGRKAKDKPALAPGDEGYGTARAHAVAAERGLDHAAVHRIAADVLRIDEGDLAAFSVKDLTEADWEPVVAALSEAPVDEAGAEEFAGRMALLAGMGSGDNPWEEAEPAAAEMFGVKADELSAAHWREFGIRVYARHPLP